MLGGPLLEALRRSESFEHIYIWKRHENLDDCPRDVTAILHAAADTRFSAPLDVARAANVEVTRDVLRFAERCLRLEKFAYLSTVYVAGKRTGTICESELEHDAGFVNAYEQSKYEAELWLRSQSLPIAVYRLSTIFSETGKLGGIHQALRFFYHSLAPMIPGQPDSPVDLISLDYAVNAVSYLFAERFVAGETLHICAGDDTLPLSELLDLTYACFLRDRPAWRKRAIEKPPIVDLATFELFARSVEEIGDSALRQCVTAIKHFAPQLAFPKHFYDTACARALAGGGIVKPAVREFYPRVISRLIECNWRPHERAAEFCESRAVA